MNKNMISAFMLALSVTLSSPAIADNPDSSTRSALSTLRASNAGLERFVLDNGMICLVKEDRSAPVVSVQIWIGTGSIHENEFLGSGLSHAVEHMAFKGTKNRDMGAIWSEITDAGGRLNAYTSFDRTVFHSDIPSASWKVALDVLSDAVMNSTLPAEEWKKEKNVILREFAMGKDDPDRVVGKMLWSTAYRVHPYRFPVIGIEDIFKQRTREDVAKFFNFHYAPDNMITVIVGDINLKEAKKTLRKTYAGFKRQARKPVILPEEPVQMTPRFSRKTGAYQVSRVDIGLHTVPMSHPDAPALDLIGQIVGEGRSSRLNRKLKEELKLVHSISAGSYTRKEPGLFVVSAVMSPEKEAEAIEAIKKEIWSWSQSPVSQEELARAKRRTLVSTLGSLATMHGQSSSYASGEFYAGDPLFSESYIQSLDKVTATALQRVTEKYLRPGNLNVAVLAPEGKKDELKTGTNNKSQAKISKLKLSNGISLIVREDHKLPFVYFSAAFKGGLLSETDKNNGITALMSELLTRGTKKRTSEEIAREIESLGASLSTFFGRNSFGIQGKCLRSDADTLMEIIADCLLNSTFAQSEIDKQKTVQLAAIDQLKERPMSVAQEELRQILHPGHPYSMDANGTKKSVEAITRADIQKHLQSYAVNNNMAFAVFGDISPEQAKKLVAPYLEKTTRGKAPNLKHRAPKPSLPRVIVREEPKEQAVFLAGFPAVSINDPRADALDIMTDSLSGLSSKLGIEVREKRGLVYYIGAVMRPGLEPGTIFIYAGTRAEALEELEELARLEIDRLVKNGLDKKEFESAKNRIIARYERGLQNNGSLAMTACLNELYGLGYMHEFKTKERIEKITMEDVLKATRSILKTDNMGISIVVPEKKDVNHGADTETRRKK